MNENLSRALTAPAALAALCLVCAVTAGCGKKADDAPAGATAPAAAASTQDPAWSRPPNAEAAAGAAEFERQRRAFEERDKRTAAQGK